MTELVLPGVVLLAALGLTAGLTWRDPGLTAPGHSRDRTFATAIWPICCLMAVGFMATLDYQLSAVLYGAAGLYAGLCLVTGARPVVLFDRLLVGPEAGARTPMPPAVRRSRLRTVVGVVALLTAIGVLDWLT